MTPTTCPSCGATLPEGAGACTYCGRRVPKQQSTAPQMPVEVRGDEPAAATEEQLRRNRHAILIALLACGAVLALGALVAVLLAAQGIEDSTQGAVSTHRIEYRVSGTVRNATVTYTNATGGTEQREERLPWKETLSMEDVPYVYVAALSIGETGRITCEIWLDGDLWKESTSSGTGVMVTCGGVPGGP